MHVTLVPTDALDFIEEANRCGVAHSFVQNRTQGSSTQLLWKPEWEGPELEIFLRADGTWNARLCHVRSPLDGD